MSATGDTYPKAITLQNDAGAAQSYADKSAFTAAGWDVTFYDDAGSALSSQPTWTVADLGSGVHQIAYVIPAGFYVAVLTVPSGFAANIDSWEGEGETYDTDGLGGLLQTANGQTLGETRTTGTLEDLVHGDSLQYSISIPESALTRVGVASLAAATITAAAKRAFPDAESADAAADVPLTVTVETDSSGARVVKVTASVTDLSNGSVVLSTGESSRAYVIDVTLSDDPTTPTNILTAAQVSFNLIWQANNQ